MFAGDTVNVSAGNYNETVSTVRSGAVGSRITFKGSPGAVIKTFLNVNHNYITIDGFEMTGANQGYMTIWNGTNGELLNNTIHDTGSSFEIIRGYGDNLVIRSNLYYSSTGPGDDLPVFILAGDNQIAENNEIGPAKDIDAFRVFGVGNVFRGNYIHDATLSSGSSSHMDVIQTFGLNGATCHDVIFERNIITAAPDMQMFMTEANNNANMHDWDVRNNIYVNVGGQANFGIPNIRFYNNTLYTSGAANNLILYLYDVAGKSNFSGARIKNNLIVAPSGVTSYGQTISIGSSGSDIQADYNFITRSTFATVSGFPEANGINGGNPHFVNAAANDFHLTASSAAIDQGVTLSGFSNDYEGGFRPQGAAWDMGAFERSSTAAGRISHWKFDESSGTSAADFADGNTLTLTGGASFATGGQLGNALSLKGTTGYAIDTSTTGINSTATLTISAWLKPNLQTGYRTVISKGSSSPARGYAVNLLEGNLNFVKVGAADVPSGVSIPTGAFYHIAVTWNESAEVAQFYVDGILSQTVSSAGAITPPLDADPLVVGKFLGSASFFDGLIDDLRLYGRVLTQSEIVALAGKGPPPPPPSPVEAVPATPQNPIPCTGSRCRVPIACNLVQDQGASCANRIDLFALVPRKIRFAFGIANVPPDEIKNVRLRLTKKGKRIFETSKKRRRSGVIEIRNRPGTVTESTPITIKLGRR